MVYDQSKANLAYFNGNQWNNLSNGQDLYARFPVSKSFTASFYFAEPSSENFDFVVPSGVNKIWVEAWGGGGNGSNITTHQSAIFGGPGGDFISVILPVIAGNTMEIVVSKGGNNTFGLSKTYIYPVKNQGPHLYAGAGGFENNFQFSITNAELIRHVGGDVKIQGKVSYQNQLSNGYSILVTDADGGGAYPNYRKATSSTFIFNSASNYSATWGTNNYGVFPGGGGPAVATGVSFGAPGLVILHW